MSQKSNQNGVSFLPEQSLIISLSIAYYSMINSNHVKVDPIQVRRKNPLPKGFLLFVFH